MTQPRILQFGATGQLGQELVRCAGRQDIRLHVLSREVADFTDPDGIRRAVLETADVDAVVNAAAYTAVDRAESEEELARTVNADTVRVLALACAERGLPLFHVSTDYVYDGDKPEPYVETDRPNPLSAYGRTKLAGEEAIRDSGARHVILRTSWVYSSFGANFVKTILRLGAERDELRVVADQYGAPTAAGDLADTILRIAARLSTPADDHAYGTFHYTGAGTASWYQFAQAIFEMAGDRFELKAQLVPIAASDYPAVARRPRNSRLDCTKIAAVHHIEPRPWRSALAVVLDELSRRSAT